MNTRPMNIMIPLDGSPLAEAAIDAVKPFQEIRQTTLHLLAVCQSHEIPATKMNYLARLRNSLEALGFRVAAHLKLGDPAECILQAAQELTLDLLAMSTHGHTGLRRLLTGSVTEEVLRRIEIPTLICREGNASGKLKRILLPLDGTPEAEEAIPEAIRFAQRLGAEIHLLRVVVPAAAPSGFGGVPLPLPPESALPYLKRVCNEIAVHGVAAEPVVRHGLPGETLATYATEARIDLICMMTHGRRGVPRFFLGSVAEEVFRAAPCPVLVRRLTDNPKPATTKQS